MDLSSPQRRAKLPGVVAVYSEAIALPFPFAVVRPSRLGRDAAAELTVEDPKASRMHVKLEPATGGLLATDLESHNGTFVCGGRVGRKPVLVPYGATIRVGRVLFLVVEDVERFRGFPPLPEEPLIGGPALQNVRLRICAVAHGTLPVLIEGETGTGKERAAQGIHEASGRHGHFVRVNCATLPRDLIESELFGHAKGAFSGSVQGRLGLIRRADNGTLFLDEIGELPLAAQSKLLRVLEEGQVRPIGQDHSVPVDVRIVLATNRDLRAMAERGEFRTDLLHRFGAAPIRLPPLRERLEDIPLMTSYYQDEIGLPVDVAAMESLMARAWPGNVRELHHVLLAASATAHMRGAATLEVGDVPAAATSVPPTVQEPEPRESASREVVKAKVLTALQLREGNVSLVARDLGMRRARLYEIFLRFGIDPSSFRKNPSSGG